MGKREALQALLDGENADIRDRVRTELSKPDHEPPPAGLPTEEHRRLVAQWTKELAEEGQPSMLFPQEYGGEGDVAKGVAGFEVLAFGDLSLLVKCGVQFGLFGGAVHHLGTKRHHDAYLRGVIDFSLPGAFAMTETGHGSNVQELETTITYDHDARELIVDTPTESARKDYIGNAARDGRMAAVFGQLIVGGEGRGVHAVLVPLRDDDGDVVPGVRIEDCGQKLGLNGVDNGRIWFDSVRVPVDNLLDLHAQIREDGSYHSPIENPTKRFFTMLGTLIQGRVSVCGAAINATKVAQVIAVRHALQRHQFGPPDGAEVRLLEYRTHQRRLLPGIATTYALHFAQDQLRTQLHEVFTGANEDPIDRRKLETLAAGLKAVATWHATDTIQACREACGGSGYLASNRFAALKADTDVFTTFEGDNTVLMQLCAKNLLTEYRDQFGELDPLGLAQFFAGQVFDTVAERSAAREAFGRLADAIIPGRDDGGDLCDREVQLDLVRWRQEHILSGAARRLRAGIQSGADPFRVLVACQDHVVACARAWVDLVVLEQFAAAVERVEDEELRGVLDKLCSLYALWGIERERGWYQEHGRLSSIRSKAVLKAVNSLCEDLKDHAELLVEAYGVPETSLGDMRRVEEAAR